MTGNSSGVPCHAHPVLHRLGDAVQVHVAGDDLVGGVGDADEGRRSSSRVRPSADRASGAAFQAAVILALRAVILALTCSGLAGGHGNPPEGFGAGDGEFVVSTALLALRALTAAFFRRRDCDPGSRFLPDATSWRR
jgi:hypothetical protein